MNSVGIDISKGKSMVAVMRPFGEVVCSPFEISHTTSELTALAKQLKSLKGETRVVMEATGNYHMPVARVLYDAGLYVSVVDPVLVHDYKKNSLRRVKTDRKDSVKIANFGLDNWLDLPCYLPVEETRILLKSCFRQVQQSLKVRTMLNNSLISLLDKVFPGVNRLFSSPPRGDGSEKWVDFVDAFWHCQCVYMPSTVDYSKKIEKAKQKSAAEIDQIAHYEELQEKALHAQIYSFGWFCTLLEMESLNSGESNANSREISISFAKVEREENMRIS